MRFDNSYALLPERFFARAEAAPVSAPELLAWNSELAEYLGLGELTEERLAPLFSGNERLPGSEPIALAYAGHQFGAFVPQLGDGRALLLGELISPIDGRRFDVQLKGSGRTPFSRNGDGKSSLGPVIREYLVSEAMHRLGVPTTRALAAVSSGERVLRDGYEPGGVLTRVAASHIRIGTFAYFAARSDNEALKQLCEHASARHYPETLTADRPVLAFFAQVVEAQARLVAHWLSLGFIHGVMNTDNSSISGETLDYGPCAFMDEFDINKVFSSIDRRGRYAFGQQAAITQWNLARLAECLMPLDGDKEEYQALLEAFQPQFEQPFFALMRSKLGLSQLEAEDSSVVTDWFQTLQEAQLDYTQSYHHLAALLDEPESKRFGDFGVRWRKRVQEQPGGAARARELMAASNPLYIPRNHQIERAIAAAFTGDFSLFNELRLLLSEPFREQEGMAAYAEPPRPEERVQMTFCGT